uniref:Ovule protein n=1 Tax=Ditylenchus dipsaci TaxID=166011 RepID=A0A915DCQ7_9BILA
MVAHNMLEIVPEANISIILCHQSNFAMTQSGECPHPQMTGQYPKKKKRQKYLPPFLNSQPTTLNSQSRA